MYDLSVFSSTTRQYERPRHSSDAFTTSRAPGLSAAAFPWLGLSSNLTALPTRSAACR